MPSKTPKSRKKRSQTVPQDSEILNARGAAQSLGVSAALILRLAREGKLPGKKVGRAWRFRRSAILKWLADVEVQSPLPEWLQESLDSGRATPLPTKKKK